MFFVLAISCNKDENNTNNINPPSTAIKDIDGNVYHAVTIGTQVWMLENLKTTRFRNGDPIPHITDQIAWNALTTAAYCNYNNDNSYPNTYGHLYNFFAVSDSRNIAPLGWHVAADTEWVSLFNYLGGELIAGGKLKETDTIHWNSPNADATNESGFTALPGGMRYASNIGTFDLIGQYGRWWSFTAYNTTLGKSVEMRYIDGVASNSINKKGLGFSVRCIKD